MIPSYPKIHNIGNKAAGTAGGMIVVQEKVDGSQFSFMLDADGIVHYRSKNKEVFPGDAGMFDKAIEHVESVKHLLWQDMIYRCEYLRAPRHNTLCYDNTPNGHLVLFDAETEDGFLPTATLEQWAHKIGVSPVPYLESCDWGDIDLSSLNGWLDQESFLGGPKIEGVVLKNYDVYDQYGQTVMLKYVSEAYKETHSKSWRKENPSGKDNLAAIAECFRTERRWEKAVEALRDSGVLQGAPQDIGPLMKHVKEDISDECVEDIKEALWKYAKPHILRRSTAGLPEWYKQKLFGEAVGDETRND